MPTSDNQEPLTGKRILFVITQSKYGGAQRYLLDLAAYFCQHNEALIAVGEVRDQDPLFFGRARALGIEPLLVKSLVRDISLVKAYEATLELRALYANVKPDIVHINSSMAGAIGSCAAWLLGFDPLARTPKVIYTAHGFVFNEPLSRSRFLLYKWIEKISAAWKHVIIAVSNFDRDSALKQSIASASKIVVIHNGVDTATPFVKRNEAHQSLGIPKTNEPIIGAISSHYPVKGLEHLLTACELLQGMSIPTQCYIIGDGPERPRLESLITNLGLTETVHLLGAIPDATRYLYAFDVFVMPSLKEGLPYALLEAGLANVPVIATHVGGIPEIVKDGVSGLLVPPHDSSALANAIVDVLNNHQQALTRASALADTIRSSFSKDRMLDQTEAVYQRLFRKSITAASSSAPDRHTADRAT